MNVVKLIGGCFLSTGIAVMLLGSAMVPISAPIWGDEGGAAGCTSSVGCSLGCVDKIPPCTGSLAKCAITVAGCEQCLCEEVGTAPNSACSCKVFGPID